MTEYTVYERSRKGTGFDYWLAPKGAEKPLFQDKARLEISGVRNGDDGVVSARAAKKMKQTELNDGASIRNAPGGAGMDAKQARNPIWNILEYHSSRSILFEFQ